MINLSLAGLLGAVTGTIVAALVYVPLVDFVERGLRSRADSGAEGETLEQEISLLRRRVRGRYHRVRGHRLLARRDNGGLSGMPRWNAMPERIAR